MATAIVPYTPDFRYDPSYMLPLLKYVSGVLKDPLVFYGHHGNVLCDIEIRNGAGGLLPAQGIFGSRVVFTGTATGAWQLPTAAELLTEINSNVFGSLFPKQIPSGQSFQVCTTFRNDTNAAITLATNTGLTLVPNPITVPGDSNTKIVFEVVGSTFGTAAFNVWVENSGSGSGAQNTLVTADPFITVTNPDINEWHLSLTGPTQVFDVDDNLLAYWNANLQQFVNQGNIQQTGARTGTPAVYAGQVLTSNFAVLAGLDVSSSVAYFAPLPRYTADNVNSGIIIEQPGVYLIQAQAFTQTLNPATPGGAVTNATLPTTPIHMDVVFNGAAVAFSNGPTQFVTNACVLQRFMRIETVPTLVQISIGQQAAPFSTVVRANLFVQALF